jgi:Family of unknown function (DUF5681)
MANSGKAKPTGGYSIGYGRPPMNSRFKKGESGNLNGRPKGVLNFSTVLLKTLREKVVINENGERMVITKLEAAVKQLVNRAASGDLRAVSHLIGITLAAEQSAAEKVRPKEILNELDKKVMFNILKRYEKSLAKEGS